VAAALVAQAAQAAQMETVQPSVAR
jgi:hypothetical protein